MTHIVRYLTHPQVVIDAAVPVPQWPLNDEGTARVQRIAGCMAFADTVAIFSSAEVKAVQTATPLAAAVGVPVTVVEAMHENDRSATGFLPGPEFETVADAFFGSPTVSIRGWETAQAAQNRIFAATKAALVQAGPGDILLVGHGGVGTLLYCALAGVPIDRSYDQGPGGGGNVFTFGRDTLQPLQHWQPMEMLQD